MNIEDYSIVDNYKENLKSKIIAEQKSYTQSQTKENKTRVVRLKSEVKSGYREEVVDGSTYYSPIVPLPVIFID